MKFSISKNRLLGVLLHLKNAVPSWKTANGSAAGYVWRSFIFEAKNDNLVIQATDSEILMKEEMSLLEPVEENKTFAVDATQLIKAIKTLDDQPLDFEVLEYQVIVHHETGHFALPLAQGIECYFDGKGIGVDYREAKYLNIEAPGLKSILARCAYAMADDYLRPVMNGVCVNITENYTDFAASDGHLLVRIRQKGQNEKKAMCVLPKRIVNILLKVLPKTGFVLMQLNEYEPDTKVEKGVKTPAPCCRIAVDNIELVFSPIQGRYPNYDSVIPTTHTKECQVKRISLIKSIERLMQFTPDSSGLIVVYMENEKMRLETKDYDFAVEANETIPCQYKGDKLRIGYKDEGIIKILKNLNAEYVTFYCTDESRASIVQPTIQAENEDALMLIMPMLVSDDYFKGED